MHELFFWGATCKYLVEQLKMPADTPERSERPSAAPPAVAAPPSGTATPGGPLLRSSDSRKSKPIMEKRRRARINASLGQLKTLILHALKKDSSSHSKLEKADILEMTVKHLRGLQRLHSTVTSDPPGRYRAGFSECVGEVTRFLSTCEGVSAQVRTHLLGHLAACVSQISAAVNATNATNATNANLNAQRGGGGQSSVYPPHPASVLGLLGQTVVQLAAGTPLPPPPPPLTPCKRSSAALSLSCGEAVKLCGGFQVVPAADGQLAFLISTAALAPLSSAPGGQRPATAAPVAPRLGTAPHPGTADSVWRPW